MGAPERPTGRIADGEPMQITTVVPSFAWRCDTCGWLGIGHLSRSSARNEMGRHLREQHTDQWPRHTDGMPCFHTDSDCHEHGSCMDCDMCKRLCECN